MLILNNGQSSGRCVLVTGPFQRFLCAGDQLKSEQLQFAQMLATGKTNPMTIGSNTAPEIDAQRNPFLVRAKLRTKNGGAMNLSMRLAFK